MLCRVPASVFQAKVMLERDKKHGTEVSITCSYDVLPAVKDKRLTEYQKNASSEPLIPLPACAVTYDTYRD